MSSWTTAEFRDGGGVEPRQRRERERPVVIELDETLGLFGGSPRLGLQGIGHMLHQKRAIGLEERQHLIRQRVHCFVHDHALGVFSPAERRRQRQKQNRSRRQRGRSAKAHAV